VCERLIGQHSSEASREAVHERHMVIGLWVGRERGGRERGMGSVEDGGALREASECGSFLGGSESEMESERARALSALAGMCIRAYETRIRGH
jgi:hypothetical protein